MKIRNAKLEELDKILEIYEGGKKFMRAHGNMTQWTGGYPQRELLEEDINLGRLYVLAGEDADASLGILPDEILAVYAYILGDDPTYSVIYDGGWLNDKPYGTLHRLVSSGKKSGTASIVFDWALKKCDNLRADTHADNYVMQGVMENYGFKMCGVIHLANGDPRIAYHITKEMRFQAQAE